MPLAVSRGGYQHHEILFHRKEHEASKGRGREGLFRVHTLVFVVPSLERAIIHPVVFLLFLGSGTEYLGPYRSQQMKSQICILQT